VFDDDDGVLLGLVEKESELDRNLSTNRHQNGHYRSKAASCSSKLDPAQRDDCCP